MKIMFKKKKMELQKKKNPCSVRFLFYWQSSTLRGVLGRFRRRIFTLKTLGTKSYRLKLVLGAGRVWLC